MGGWTHQWTSAWTSYVQMNLFRMAFNLKLYLQTNFAGYEPVVSASPSIYCPASGKGEALMLPSGRGAALTASYHNKTSLPSLPRTAARSILLKANGSNRDKDIITNLNPLLSLR